MLWWERGLKMPNVLEPAAIQQWRAEIESSLAELNAELEGLQKLCTHPCVTKKYRSNTGNYDPSADCYWIEWSCPDCGKYWTTEQ